MNKCICEGNFRKIVNETHHLLNKDYRRVRTGKLYTFYGVVWGSDDLYYGMYGENGETKLLSCVGSIEGHGYELVAPLETAEELMRQMEKIENELEARRYQLQMRKQIFIKNLWPEYDHNIHTIPFAWECSKSPFGYCAYNEYEDPALDDCVFCHYPYERK